MRVRLEPWNTLRCALLSLLLTAGSEVFAQNCAIPRVVRISSDVPELTETAPPGTILVKMSSQNIEFAEAIPFSPTNFVRLQIKKDIKELLLTLERPLKNYLDDSRSKTVDFQANLVCKDGRNKTVLFQIPFKDENTKIPQFSQREYFGIIALTSLATPLDLNVAIIDDDRDEENAEVCVELISVHDAEFIDVAVISQYPTLRALDGGYIPDQYTYNVSVHLRNGFEEFYKNIGAIKFKLATWNKMSGQQCNTVVGNGATNYADVTLTLISNGDGTTAAWTTPDAVVTPPPSESICYVVKFSSSYYKAVIKSLDETGKDVELKPIWPTTVTAVSSSGEFVRYGLDTSEYFRIEASNGRIYFKQEITQEMVDDLVDSMVIAEIKASDGASSAVVSLIVLFDISEELPTTAIDSTTETVCPSCPSSEPTTTKAPGECPVTTCPTPIVCPTDPSTTTATSTITTTEGPSAPCSKCECSTFVCPAAGLFPDPHSCTSYYNCRDSGDEPYRQPCAAGGTVFCPSTGQCEWNIEGCICNDPESPCCLPCPCEDDCHLDNSCADQESQAVAMDPSCKPPRPIPTVLCYDSAGNGYIGDILHPTNCEHFLTCVEEYPGKPSPVLKDCPVNLHFNIEICSCDWPHATICPDPSNGGDERLKCAYPLNLTNGIQNGDKQDDRRSNMK